MTNTERQAVLAELHVVAEQAQRYLEQAGIPDCARAFALIGTLATDMIALARET